MSAQAQVFGTFELIEQILNQLTLYELVLAASLSQTWLSVISASSKLRKRLSEECIQMFAHYRPGIHGSEDLCNVSRTTPWFFRTALRDDGKLDDGCIVVLRISDRLVQLYVPSDKTNPIRSLAGSWTKAAYSSDYMEFQGTVEWRNNRTSSNSKQRLICRKDVKLSRWEPTKPDTMWDYVKVFSTWKRHSIDPLSKTSYKMLQLNGWDVPLGCDGE